MNNEIRVLVAESDYLRATRLVEFLNGSGLESRFVRSGSALKTALREWSPQFIITEMMLPELNGLELMHYLKKIKIKPEQTSVIVISVHNFLANVRECQKQGAIDYLVEPFQPIDLLRRIILHAHARPQLSENLGDPGDLAGDQGLHFLHLTQLVLAAAANAEKTSQLLYNFTRMAALPLKAVRCSLTECDFENQKGWVQASSDAPSIAGLEIDLMKYPELIYVGASQKIFAMDSLDLDPTMQQIVAGNKSIAFNALLAAPVHIGKKLWGVIHLRLPASKVTISEAEIRFAQNVGHIAGLVLRLQAESEAIRAA